uniref:Uncharacterized protein n=1 Tax=Arundo donax TaxID=35708 RepID=A0A0A9AER4_ARUDO
MTVINLLTPATVLLIGLIVSIQLTEDCYMLESKGEFPVCKTCCDST